MNVFHNISWASFIAGALFVQFVIPFLMGILRRGHKAPAATTAA